MSENIWFHWHASSTMKLSLSEKSGVRVTKESSIPRVPQHPVSGSWLEEEHPHLLGHTYIWTVTWVGKEDLRHQKWLVFLKNKLPLWILVSEWAHDTVDIVKEGSVIFHEVFTLIYFTALSSCLLVPFPQ